MSKTIQQCKEDMAREQKRWRRGMWVRLKGWQMHWPQRNAKIVGITDGGTAFLDRKILNESAWHVADLARPFTATPKR